MSAPSVPERDKRRRRANHKEARILAKSTTEPRLCPDCGRAFSGPKLAAHLFKVHQTRRLVIEKGRVLVELVDGTVREIRE